VGDASGTEGGLIAAIKGAEVVATQPAPLTGSRLPEAPRLLLSPHIAGASRGTANRAARLADEKVGTYARREKPTSQLNRVEMACPA